MKIGFTGTQKGLARSQYEALFRVLHGYSWAEEREFHHGNCVGGDESSHYIAGILKFKRVLHRPLSGRKEARCSFHLEPVDVLMPRKDYLERNKNIVNATEVLVACPKEEDGETLRSGTWSTVRYARSLKRKIVIIRPSGKVEIENAGTDLEN